jgi:hypothetical protein
VNTQRPARGLALETAVQKWGDPLLFAEMQEYSEWSPPLGFSKDHPLAGTYPPKHREYGRRRDVVEADFLEKLQRGELAGSGILSGARRREVIDPSLWDVLDLDFDSDSVGGNGLVFGSVEYFAPSAVPLNIPPPLPDWLAEGSAQTASFIADASYRHVTINNVAFVLSPLRAKIVRLLDEARLRGEEWQQGIDLLNGAGSRQLKLIDVFKNLEGWKHLIQSDGSGGYRLNV